VIVTVIVLALDIVVACVLSMTCTRSRCHRSTVVLARFSSSSLRAYPALVFVQSSHGHGALVGARVWQVRSRSMQRRRCSYGVPNAQPPWDEVLERRRRERIQGLRQPPPPPQGEEVEQSPPQERRDAEAEANMRQEVDKGAQALQLFAYPRNRRCPWATLSLLLMSGCLTATAAFYWNWFVRRAETLEELEPRVSMFAWALGMCSVSSDDLARAEVHRLLLTSLLHAEETPARILLNAAILVCCGTLLERLHGPVFVLTFTVVATVASNVLALVAHRRFTELSPQRCGLRDQKLMSIPSPAPSVTSTSGGVVGLGALCWLRYARWAVWPGVPVPIAWLMAPLLVADASAAVKYFRELPAYMLSVVDQAMQDHDADETPDGAEARHLAADGRDSSPLSGLELAVALAACEVVGERFRGQCRPPPDEVMQWRDELELATEVRPPSTPMQPSGAFWADIAGAGIAVALAGVLRLFGHV